LTVASPVLAQNPRGKAETALGGKTVTIDYGRPSLKGRDMLGRAEIGQPWRMGSDSPTTLTTAAELAFGTATVPKGSYVLQATRVTEKEWQLDVQDASGKQVAKIPLAASPVPESVEMFTIELKGDKGAGEFVMTWGTTALKASFKAK
jgi:hypothetical protein